MNKLESLNTEELHDLASYLNEVTRESKRAMEYNGLGSEVLHKMEDIIDLLNDIENLILYRDDEDYEGPY